MKKTFVALMAIFGIIGIFTFFLPFESVAQAKKSQPRANELQANWLENLNDALEISQETGKPILMDFTGSDWCFWCKKLDAEVFSQKPFIEYANENLVLIKIDFPSKIEQSEELIKQNQKLQKNFKITGYPTVILVKPDGKKLIKIASFGYRAGGPRPYVDYIKLLLKNYEEKSKK